MKFYEKDNQSVSLKGSIVSSQSSKYLETFG
jgi:hypothetical protein